MNVRATGPRRNETVPTKLPSSLTSRSFAPGKQGATRSTCRRRSQAATGGRGTVNSLCSFIPTRSVTAERRPVVIVAGFWRGGCGAAGMVRRAAAPTVPRMPPFARHAGAGCCSCPALDALVYYEIVMQSHNRAPGQAHGEIVLFFGIYVLYTGTNKNRRPSQNHEVRG